MKIKTGDNVKVLSGKDRGKTGKVIQVLVNKKNNQRYVVVEGVNMRKKHLRRQKQGDKGQVIELAAPLHASKVMLIDPGSKQPTRVGFRFEGNEKKRVAKKSGAVID
ncbi:MAG: 50S ribosomal protein L24 [Patescibacteria group bacterium]